MADKPDGSLNVAHVWAQNLTDELLRAHVRIAYHQHSALNEIEAAKDAYARLTAELTALGLINQAMTNQNPNEE